MFAHKMGSSLQLSLGKLSLGSDVGFHGADCGDQL